MTTHKNNIKACELLEEIQEEAGNLWGNYQSYTSRSVDNVTIIILKQQLKDLKIYNKLAER